jgi:hypothetical protein
MTKLSDSSITINLANKEVELVASVNALLTLSRGSSLAVDGKGNVIPIKGLRQYVLALQELDVERIAELLKVGLNEVNATIEDMVELMFQTEGGVAGVALQLYPYIDLLNNGGRKTQLEVTEKKSPTKAQKV